MRETDQGLIGSAEIEVLRQAVGQEEKKHHLVEANFIAQLKAQAHREVDPENLAIALSGVTFRYPQSKGPTVSNITFMLPKAEILAIRGESGSGKSTILRLIAGFLNPQEGQIIIDNQIVAGSKTVPPEKRNVGIVFQDYALFPHMSVRKNVAYGVGTMKNLSRKEKHERVSQMLQLVGLEDLDSQYPEQLSGGQQQRVAIARALAPKPQLLLLDEPFSNIDESRRHYVRGEIARIIRQTKVSAILVTHDLHDVSEIADRAVEIEEGRLI